MDKVKYTDNDSVAIKGVGKDVSIETTASGAQQSAIPYRFDLLPPLAIFALARIVDYGAGKYGEEQWRVIEVKSHLNHALMHVFSYLAGDMQDDHLSHALCRIAFAMELSIKK